MDGLVKAFGANSLHEQMNEGHLRAGHLCSVNYCMPL
jgi:hypothetical protein